MEDEMYKVQIELGEILMKSNLTRNEKFGVLEGCKGFFLWEYMKEMDETQK